MYLKIPNELLYYLYPKPSQLFMAVTVFIDDFFMILKIIKKHSEEIELFANPFNPFFMSAKFANCFFSSRRRCWRNIESMFFRSDNNRKMTFIHNILNIFVSRHHLLFCLFVIHNWAQVNFCIPLLIYDLFCSIFG